MNRDLVLEVKGELLYVLIHCEHMRCEEVRGHVRGAIEKLHEALKEVNCGRHAQQN